MKYRIHWIVAALIVLCLTATAQEGERLKLKLEDEEMTLDLSDLNRLVSRLTADIEEQVGDLTSLIDLDKMVEEVHDLIEPTKKEKKIVKALLEEFRSHWVDGKSICKPGDDEWIEEITAQAEDLLPERKADLFIDWLMERNEKLTRRVSRMGDLGRDMGLRAQKLAELYSRDAMKFGRQGEAWAEYARQMAERIARGSEKSARKYAETARKLAESHQFKLQKKLSDQTLKELRELAELGEQDWEELSKRLGSLSKIRVNGIDLDLYMDSIDEIVEQSLAAGLEAAAMAGKVDEGELAAYAEEVARAAEAYRNALDLKRSDRSEKSRGEWSALREALRAAGLKDREKGALKEYFEQSEQQKENKFEAAKKSLMRNLKEQEREIQSRDTELRELREEIRDLKREVERLRREQRALDRKRRDRDDEEEGTFL
jgi:hypothetical protein